MNSDFVKFLDRSEESIAKGKLPFQSSVNQRTAVADLLDQLEQSKSRAKRYKRKCNEKDKVIRLLEEKNEHLERLVAENEKKIAERDHHIERAWGVLQQFQNQNQNDGNTKINNNKSRDSPEPKNKKQKLDSEGSDEDYDSLEDDEEEDDAYSIEQIDQRRKKIYQNKKGDMSTHSGTTRAYILKFLNAQPQDKFSSLREICNGINVLAHEAGEKKKEKYQINSISPRLYELVCSGRVDRTKNHNKPSKRYIYRISSKGKGKN